MKKKKYKSEAPDQHEQQDQPQVQEERVADMETAQEEPVRKDVSKKYVGPDYTFGVVLPGTIDMIRPRELTEAERKAVIQRYPPAADWWR